MFCNAFGKVHARIDDFLIVDGEVVCSKAAYKEQEDFYGEDVLSDLEVQPVWLGGMTNEEGEVYGG